MFLFAQGILIYYKLYIYFIFCRRRDAAKTCQEPWTYVDEKAKILKVKVCHLTQFSLFWTFEDEKGIFGFVKATNGMSTTISFSLTVYEGYNLTKLFDKFCGIFLKYQYFSGDSEVIA